MADDVIARVMRGSGSVLVIEGPPGIGKTRLVSEIMTRAASAGAHVLSGRAFDDQQTVPFGPVLSAVVGADPPLGELDVLEKLGSSAELGFWVVHELRATLAAAATKRPLLIAIDDVHWADAGTLTALRNLVPGLASRPVAWVLAARHAEGRGNVRATIDALAATAGVHAVRLRLPALGQGAVIEIASDTLRADVDASLVDLVSRAHGNPYLVLELLRGLREEGRIRLTDGGASAVGAHMPQRLTENMDQRLTRLSDCAARVVQVASILPSSFPLSLLGEMLGQGPAQLLGSVAEAVRADLLAEDGDLLRFRHDLLRQAARQSIPHPVRRGLERESARLLLARGAGPADVAVQLARSADIGDVEAASALRNAAVSLGQSDPTAAADLSMRAIELLLPDDPLRPVVIAETVERLNRATRYREAEQLAATTVSGDLPDEAQALIRLSMSTVIEGYASGRVAQNRLALELSGVSAATRARHLGYLAHGLVFEGLTREAAEAAATAWDAAVASDDLYARLLAEIALANVDCSLGRGRATLERTYRMLGLAQEAEEKISALTVCHCANLLMVVGHIDEANALCDMAIGSAQEAHHDEAIAIFTHFRAVGELISGRLDAVTPLLATLPDDQRYGMDNINTQVGSVTTAALSALTEDADLQKLMCEAAAPGLHAGIAERRAAVGMLTHIAWQRGDVDDASRWLGEELDLLGTPPSPIHLDHLVIAARVVGASGDAGLRERVLTAVARLLADDDPLPVFAGVALHARGLLEFDLAALTNAVAVLDGIGRPLLHAGALEDAGNLEAARDERTRAIDHLTAAFETYRRCGSTGDARRVARTLQRLGVARRVVRARPTVGWNSLTPSERRIVELVTGGASNKDVAAALSVSPNTVNTHLRKVFKKLGVHSRAELAALDERGST